MARSMISFNRDWAFRYDPNSEPDLQWMQPEADVADWKPVALPHSWSTYETTKELHPFMRAPSEKDDEFWWYGWGYYRKTFRISAAHRGRKLFAEFGAVMKYCQIWLNGVLIGEHKGGYASFSVDLSPQLRFGEDNVLAVAVSNRRNDHFGGIPPMTAGNFNVYGGIYREVQLVATGLMHIPFQGSADHEGGTRVTTPHIAEEAARVEVQTYVRNEHGERRQGRLRSTVLAPDGQTVATVESEAMLEPGERYEFHQTVQVPYPQLWSPEQPTLYRIVSELECEGEPTDRYESPLGFRTFHWDEQHNRLCLNGKLIHIHGTNRHQEFPWLGDAIPRWMDEADLQDIRFQLGHNFLRTCHYMQDAYVYDWCDRNGMLVCEEVPCIKSIAFGEEEQRRQVIEMIRRDRNHPSIVMWSMGNETNRPANGAWAKAEDSTRIIHYRHVKGEHPHMEHTHEQMDMENVLRCSIRGWHNREVKELEPVVGQHAGHEKWQHDQAMIEGGSQRGSIHTNGLMWIYADHGADREYVHSPLKHMNPKGWVDSYRVPKLIYYLWQANWAEQPMVYVHPYDWTARFVGQPRDVTVNSNCDEVELWIDGVSLGRQTVSRERFHTVVFANVTVRRGTLLAVGYRDGQEAVARHELSMAGAAARLQATALHPVLPADRSGITLVEIDIVDAAGRHVYGARNELQVSIEGPGTLPGPEVYRSDFALDEQAEGTMYIDAPLRIPVRSGAVPGTIRVIVRSPQLESAEVCIEVREPATAEEQAFGLEQPRLSDQAGQRAVVGTALPRLLKLDTEGDRSLPFLHETFEDIDFSTVAELQYESLLEQRIRKWNDALSFDPLAYPLFVEKLLAHLREDGGIVVADDYNIYVRQYNGYVQLSHWIGRHWPDRSGRKPLRLQFAQRLIVDGEEVDVNEEKAHLQQLAHTMT